MKRMEDLSGESKWKKDKENQNRKWVGVFL